MNASSEPRTGRPVSEARPPRRPFKRLLQNLALASATFFLCFVVFEVALRFLGYGNLEIYQPDPSLYWRLKPNQKCYTKVNRRPVRINSLGTRGAEFTPAKPENTVRVLCLGDSRTFGWGLDEAETYPARLGALLQARAGSGRRVEVINAGVNAWSYPQMLVYFRDIAVRYNPDIVVVGEANLWTQFSEHNSPEFVHKFMNRVRLKNFLRKFASYHFIVEVKLKGFYEKHRTKFIPVDPARDTFFKEQQASDPEAAFREAILSLCSVAISNHVKPMLLFLPTAEELSPTKAPAVLTVKSNIATAMSIPLLDMTARCKEGAKALYLDADTVHFNARGNELIARGLSEVAARESGL